MYPHRLVQRHRAECRRGCDSSPHCQFVKEMFYRRTSSIASRALKVHAPPSRLFHASPRRLTASSSSAGSSKSWSGITVAGVALGSSILGWAVAQRGQKEHAADNIKTTTEAVKSETPGQGYASLAQMEAVSLPTTYTRTETC